MGKRPTTGVHAVERVLELLELMADNDGSLTLSQLASCAGLPSPTAHRLLRTLAAKGYVRQHTNRRYALGPALIPLGRQATKQLGAAADSALTSLVDELGETANMAVLDANMVLYIAQAPSPYFMRTFTEVGRRVHAHNTGVGKAILAQLNDDAVIALVTQAGMPTPTERSIGTVAYLVRELKTIRERGYSIDDGEQEIGVRCLAVAVPNSPTPSAISVSGPAVRVNDNFVERAVPLLQQAAQAISRGLTPGRLD